MSGGWVVVLRPDGVVDAVEGGAPASWLGRPMADAPGAPTSLKRAADDLCHVGSTTGYVRRRSVRVDVGVQKVDVELLLMEGLPLRRVETRIDSLIMRTLDVFLAQARTADITLTVGLEPDVPPTLLVDGEKLAWSLATLVGNALRFVRPRSVAADESPRPPPSVDVHVRWDEKSREITITVKDNGPGMPQSRARWLFERNPETGSAAGLALLMVRDVLVAHHGSVSVESAVGEGTTFTLRIPQRKPSSTDAPPREE